MVASIGNLVNKLFSSSNFSSSTMTNSQAFSILTVFPNNMRMDFSTGPIPDNYDEVRGRNLSTNRSISRDMSMSSTKSSVVYHERMVYNNLNNDDKPMDPTPALSYKTEQKRTLHFSKAAEQQKHTRTNGGNIEATVAHSTEDKGIINIQLQYDPQAPTDPELWSGSFHPISLHGLIEQITSNAKNIKDFLNFMAKYIINKQVNSNKVNDLEDFKGMGDSILNVISLVYQAKRDSLYTDNNSTTLRAKISSKFTPRVVPNPSKSNKEIAKAIPVTIKRAPLPPPLLAKSKKEVNVILKYFQSNKTLAEPKNLNRSYTQVSKQNANTSEVLKIKESFPTLNTKEIDQVNNIIKGNSKPKPCIQITMKEPSKKQVIVPMSINNNNTFMRNLATHVVNINRLLRNTKSEVLVDYIHLDSLKILVITNKVSQQSDLQIIDQYIKNSEDINSLRVDKPRLSQSK